MKLQRNLFPVSTVYVVNVASQRLLQMNWEGNFGKKGQWLVTTQRVLFPSASCYSIRRGPIVPAFLSRSTELWVPILEVLVCTDILAVYWVCSAL